MYVLYILYSVSSVKTYVGFTADIIRRMNEHNFTESKGFTLRYRPWVLIHTENYETKSEAMKRETFLKTGRGREEVKIFVSNFLNRNRAVSARGGKGLKILMSPVQSRPKLILGRRYPEHLGTTHTQQHQ